MVMKIYCFDLDETLCTTVGDDYGSAVGKVTRINKVNSLYELGHVIKIYTARGSKTGIDWRSLTESQLAKWGVRYHELHFGKPFADLYIDDKGVSDIDFFEETPR
jgi:hypothetical protein